MPCLLLRIGFVGELGYEIHLPTAAGEYLWDALMAAGAEHDVRPFGLEPQRVLRLEKMHVIVGQDTNAESNPFEAAMPWIVKLDKESDWIGRYQLEYLNRRGNRNELIGFVCDNGKTPVEGSQVIGADGDPAGRITSSRFSKRLGRAIGIAWVPVDSSEEGNADRHLRPDRRQDPGGRHAQGLLRPGWREVALMSDSFAFLSPAAVRATGRPPAAAAHPGRAKPHRRRRHDRGGRRLADRPLRRRAGRARGWPTCRTRASSTSAATPRGSTS